MKLHLPKFLRASLLACFSFVAPLAQTVSTGAFLGGVVTCALLAPQAQADEYTNLATDFEESLDLEGAAEGEEAKQIIIYDAYTDEDDEIVVGNYVGSDSVATSNLVLTTTSGYYQLAGTGTYDMSGVNITVATDVTANICADSTGASSYSFGTLNMESGSRVYLYFDLSTEAVTSGYMSFETLTGSGYVDATLNHGTYSSDNEATGDYVVNFDHIDNFIGTVKTRSGESWGGKFGGGTMITISKVTVTDAANTTTIEGPYIYSDDLTFAGAGTLNITGTLNFSGDSLSMLNEGNLSIASLVVSQDLTLSYDGDSTTLNVANVTVTGTDTVYLDLSNLTLAEGTTDFDLGLVFDGDVIAQGGFEDWFVKRIDNSWVLSTNSDIPMPGTVEINTPDTVVYITLFEDREYTDENGDLVSGNFAGVVNSATQIDVINSNKAMIYFSGDVDTVISMQSTSTVNNALLVGSADGTTSNVIFAGLEISGDNNNIIWRDSTMTQVDWTFETVTGKGSLALAVSTKFDSSTFENYKLTFNNVVDLNGTIDNTTAREYWHSQAGGQIHISNVVASAGIATTIGGDIYTTGLNFSGSGSLSMVGTLNYSGDNLDMVNSGTLTIENLSLGADLTLDYTGVGTKATISGLTINDYTITLDLTGVNVSLGFDLGLSGGSITSLDGFNVTGLEGTLGVDYFFRVDSDSNSWYVYTEPSDVFYNDEVGTISVSSLVLKDAEGSIVSPEDGNDYSINFTGDALTLTLDSALAVDIFTLGSEDSSTSMTLAGSSSLSANAIYITDGSSLDMAGVTVSVNDIVAKGKTTITTNARTFATSTKLSGEGELTLNLSSGHVYFHGSMDFDGTITVDDANVNRYFFITAADLSTVNVDKIVLANNADFVFGSTAGSSGSTLLDTTIVLSNVNNRFMTSTTTHAYQKVSTLEIISGGVVKNGQPKGLDSSGTSVTSTLAIGTITSSAEATESATLSIETDLTYGGYVSVDLIKDFNGTITTYYNSNQGLSNGTFFIGDISVGEGVTTVIDCTISSGKTGSVVYTGEKLSMLNAGQLYIGCTSDGTNTGYLSLQNDLTLTYAGDSTTLNVANVYLTGDSTVYVDLADLVIEYGVVEFDLGLVFDGEVLIANGLEDWVLSQDSTTSSWTLVYEGEGMDPIPMPGTEEINSPDSVITITLFENEKYTDEDGVLVSGNFAGVTGAASQIDVIDSNKALVSFSGVVDTVISMQSTGTVNNALLVNGADGTSNVTFAGLILSGDNNNILWRDTSMTQVDWTFDTVTGEGSLALAVSTKFDSSTFENYKLTFNNVVDLNGTIDNTTVRESWHSQAGGQIHISNVVASEGITTAINGDIYTTGLNFSGAGSLSMSGTLNYSGDNLNMMNEGSLTIGSLVLSQNLTLNYGDGSGQLAGITFSGDQGLYLDLSSLDLEALKDYQESGFDLGVSAYTEGDITYSDLSGLTDWELDEDSWTLVFTGTIDPDVDPDPEPEDNLVWGDGVDSLTGTDYVDDTIIFDANDADSDVAISGAVETGGLDISGDYTFSGESTDDSLVTGGLVVNSGTTSLEVNTTASNTEVKADGNMSVGEGATLTTDDMSVDGVFSNSGVTEVTGALVTGDNSTITNSGTLTAGDESIFATATNSGTLIAGAESSFTTATNNAGASLTTGADSTFDSLVNDGTANLGAGVSIGTLTGSSAITMTGVGNSITSYESSAGLELADGVAVEIGSFNGSDLTVGAGATVSFTSDTTLSGALSNTGTIDATGQKLTISGETSNGGDINADFLEVGANVTLGNVQTNTLALNTIGSKVEHADASVVMTMSELTVSGSETLVVGSLSSSTGSLTLDISSVIDGVLAEVGIAETTTTYTLVEGSGEDSLLAGLEIGDITFDSTTQKAIDKYTVDNFTNVTLVHDSESNDLVLNFTAIDGYILDVETGMKTDAAGNSESIFKDGTDQLVSYDVLDDVNKVIVNADKTISLEGVPADDSDDYAHLNNVSGTGTLTLVGDGADEDRFLIENESSNSSLAGLVVDSVSVTIGNAGSTITNVVLENGSMVVESGATLTTSSLTTDANSSFSGTAKLTSGGTASLAGNLSAMDLVATSGTSTINITASSLNSIKASKAEITLGAAGLGLSADSSITDSSISLSVDSSGFTSGSSIVLFDTSSLSMENTTITISDINTDGDWESLLGMSFEITLGDDVNIDYDSITIDTEGGLIGDNISFKYDESTGKFVAVTKQIDYLEMALTENGGAGLNLVMAAVGSVEDGGDIEKVMSALDEFYEDGNFAAGDKLGAAVAGATTTSLGSALMSDVSRQLGTIRNRTRAMGVNPLYINENMPYYNAWVSAEGGSSDLSADGTAAGHKLDSVGGSVGVDIDINDMLSLGVAYSYLLGDLTSDGADTAEGDMDSMYGSVYARINNKRWTHSMVATFGSVDASLNRTVTAGTDSYKTKGETDGSAFGLMYEVAYTFAVEEDSSTCLQPVFNVSYVNSSIDGYTETGSKDASLHVGDQDNNYVSFGLGAVLETVVGEDMYNRASVLSVRLMLKADAGDRQSEADVSLVSNEGVSQTVKGAEIGAVGVEFGLGITIPVTDDAGAIFADVSCEQRSGMSAVSGSVGYRFSF